MGKTYRKPPVSGMMRTPKSNRAKVYEDDPDNEHLTRHRNRRSIPPDDWDDLLVSDFRGQKWYRQEKHHDE